MTLVYLGKAIESLESEIVSLRQRIIELNFARKNSAMSEQESQDVIHKIIMKHFAEHADMETCRTAMYEIIAALTANQHITARGAWEAAHIATYQAMHLDENNLLQIDHKSYEADKAKFFRTLNQIL